MERDRTRRDDAEADRTGCVAALIEILFEGRAPSESRIEALIDRAGREERVRRWER